MAYTDDEKLSLLYTSAGKPQSAPVGSGPWLRALMLWMFNQSSMNKEWWVTSIDEKTDPVDDDVLLIEDSEDEHKKKAVKLSNMTVGDEAASSINSKIQGYVLARSFCKC